MNPNKLKFFCRIWASIFPLLPSALATFFRESWGKRREGFQVLLWLWWSLSTYNFWDIAFQADLEHRIVLWAVQEGLSSLKAGWSSSGRPVSKLYVMVHGAAEALGPREQPPHVWSWLEPRRKVEQKVASRLNSKSPYISLPDNGRRSSKQCKQSLSAAWSCFNEILEDKMALVRSATEVTSQFATQQQVASHSVPRGRTMQLPELHPLEHMLWAEPGICWAPPGKCWGSENLTKVSKS